MLTKFSGIAYVENVSNGSNPKNDNKESNGIKLGLVTDTGDSVCAGLDKRIMLVPIQIGDKLYVSFRVSCAKRQTKDNRDYMDTSINLIDYQVLEHLDINNDIRITRNSETRKKFGARATGNQAKADAVFNQMDKQKTSDLQLEDFYDWSKEYENQQDIQDNQEITSEADYK